MKQGEPIKIKLTTCIGLILATIIIGMIVIIGLIYNQIMRNQTEGNNTIASTNSTINILNINNTLEEGIEVKNLESETYKKILETIQFDSNITNSIYKAEKFNLENIPNDLILRIGWSVLEEEDYTIKKNSKKNTKEIIGKQTVKKEILEKRIKEFFGDKVKYSDESFYNTVTENLDTYNKNKGLITYSKGAYTADVYKEKSTNYSGIKESLEKVLKYSDKIEVYKTVVFCSQEDDDKYSYYSDYNFNEDKFENKIFEINTEEEEAEDYIEEYKNKLHTAKYTFYLDKTSGSYYFSGFEI